MAWIETHQSLITHRKTGRLMRALTLSRAAAVGHLTCLWLWCVDNAPDGDLTEVDTEDIADGAYWEGDSGAFVEGLVYAGYLHRADGRLQVHDWHDYAGRLIEQRRANRDRMRAARATAPEVAADISATHVQRTEPARAPATVPNQTTPNQTETIPLTPHPNAAPSVPPAATAAPGVNPPVVSKPHTAAPKPGSNYDFPEVWRLVEADQGYPPVWDYAIETKTLKRLLTAHPGAQPADFARFLAYVGTCWPFCDEPTRQPTFSEGAKHFGAWFTTGQPAQCAEPPPHGRNGHGSTNGYRESTNTQRLRAIAEQRAARNAGESASQAGALRLLPGARPG